MPKTYTTVQGDMWDLIAYKVYGNEKYMADLLKANETHRDVAVFPQGVALNCPDVVSVTAGTLPPWRD